MEFNFRPHHFLCTFCFKGSGYSASFTANFNHIVAHLNGPDGDNTQINIVNITDSICAPCPHRQQDLCESQDKIAALDQAHSKALNLQSLTKLSWGDAKQLIKEKISLPTFHNICHNCSWKAYGLCEAVLKESRL